MKAAILFVCLSTQAATYYIAANGSDTANGTSTGTPWAHLPGMVGCASVCASTTPAAGDRFILKGGDIWANGVFPVTWAWSGSSGSPIYVGVDATWYTGASWTRPKFDAQDTAISGTYNQFVRIISKNYVTIDNLEMYGLYWQGLGIYGRLGYIATSGSDYITLSNLYLHRWTHAAAGDGTTDTNLMVVLGDSNSPYAQHSVFQDGIVQNADGDSDSGYAFYAFGSVLRSTIHDLPNAIVSIVGGDKTIAWNHIYNIKESFGGTHANAIETVGGGAVGTFHIYNNLIHDLDIGESMMVGNVNETVYVFNNVIYNLLGVGANPPHFPQSSGTAGPYAAFWNNTVVPLAGNACFVQNGVVPVVEVVIQNNHCITTGALNGTLTSATQTIDHNLLQTPTTATGDGFTAASNYTPTSPTAATIGAGANLSNLGITALNLDKNGVARGAVWDVGALEYAAPPPPTTFRGVMRQGQIK